MINAAGAATAVRRVAPKAYARAFGNSVVLPSDQVMVVGGQTVTLPFSDDNAILVPYHSAILLREGYRENGKVVKRTLANLSHWDPQLVEHFRVLLKGGVAVESAASVLSIERSLPHGHVAAVLGAARGVGSAAWFGWATAAC